MSEQRTGDMVNIEQALDASVDASLALVHENDQLKRYNEALVELLNLLTDTWRREGDLDAVVKRITAEMETLEQRKIN